MGKYHSLMAQSLQVSEHLESTGLRQPIPKCLPGSAYSRVKIAKKLVRYASHLTGRGYYCPPIIYYSLKVYACEPSRFPTRLGYVDQVIILQQSLEYRHMFRRPIVFGLTAGCDLVYRAFLWDYLSLWIHGTRKKFISLIQSPWANNWSLIVLMMIVCQSLSLELVFIRVIYVHLFFSTSSLKW